MRICTVLLTTEENAPPAYVSLLKEYYPKVVRPSTEVDIKFTDRSFLGGFNEYFVLLKKQDVIEQYIKAEKEGYDAVMLNCFTDLGLQEARSILNIPVIGIREASLHLACQLGARFGILTIPLPQFNEHNRVIDAWIKDKELEARAVQNPLRNFSFLEDLRHDLYTNPSKVLVPDLLRKSRELVEEGAEVIVIGCANVGPVATLTKCVSLKVDEKEIPILDCMAIGLKTAEMMVDLKKLGVPVTSRARLYSQPSKENLKKVRVEYGLEEA